MVVYTIYNEHVTRKYRAFICGWATIFNICVWALVILSPVFIAYHSLGFWLKESTYREQPEVHYKHEFILLLQGEKLGTLLGYTTNTNFNAILGDNIRIPIVKSFDTDANSDGRKDYTSFDLQVPLLDTEIVQGAQLVLFFDYRLHKYSSLQMESLAYIHYDSSLPGQELFTEGELQFRQKSPLPHRGSYTKFNGSIIDESLKASANVYSLQNIFRAYQSRNVTTDFTGNYPVWKSGRSTSFTIKVKVSYPEETILYRPGFWQLIKFAWIQYYAIFVIFYYFIGLVKRFVYKNQLVNTIPQKLHQD